MAEEFVGKLREKTEDGDLSTMLKTSLGGYTKRSVQEYLAYVKNQQQNLKDAFTAERDLLIRERDTLSEENAALKSTAEEAVSELANVREERDLLEKDMEEALARIKSDEEEIEKLRSGTLKKRTEEIRLDTALARIDELETELGQKNVRIEELKKEKKEYKEKHSKEKVEGLIARVEELMNQVELLQNEVELRDKELDNRARRLETLAKKERESSEALEILQTELAKRTEQNEWSDSENEELGCRLREQIDKCLELVRENAKLKADNYVLQRKIGRGFCENQGIS